MNRSLWVYSTNMSRLPENLFAIFGPWHVVEVLDPLVPTVETENKRAKESDNRIVRKEEELLRKYSLLLVFPCAVGMTRTRRF